MHDNQYSPEFLSPVERRVQTVANAAYNLTSKLSEQFMKAEEIRQLQLKKAEELIEAQRQNVDIHLTSRPNIVKFSISDPVIPVITMSDKDTFIKKSMQNVADAYAYSEAA